MSATAHSLALAVRTALCGGGLVLLSFAAQAEGGFLRTRAAPQADPPAQDAQLALPPRTVTVSPGSTVVLELAIDHLNRIVTPFGQPSVRTVASLSTEVDGGVIYVATADETPATLYISDADAAQTTIALTLAPRRVPPREIRLRVPGLASRESSALSEPPSSDLAQTPWPEALATWRQPQRYIEELTEGFRALALGQNPGGEPARGARAEAVDCGPGWQVRDLMRHEDTPLRWLSATLRPVSASETVFDPSQCRVRSGAGIAAVARWPSDPPNPAEETRLILALDPARAPTQTASLTGGTR